MLKRGDWIRQQIMFFICQHFVAEEGETPFILQQLSKYAQKQDDVAAKDLLFYIIFVVAFRDVLLFIRGVQFIKNKARGDRRETMCRTAWSVLDRRPYSSIQERGALQNKLFLKASLCHGELFAVRPRLLNSTHPGMSGMKRK